MGKITQCEKVIRHLKEHGTITQLDALREYGIMRLASRVSQINKSGVMRIGTEMEQSKNRYGEKIRYARYFIIDEEES